MFTFLRSATFKVLSIIKNSKTCLNRPPQLKGNKNLMEWSEYGLKTPGLIDIECCENISSHKLQIVKSDARLRLVSFETVDGHVDLRMGHLCRHIQLNTHNYHL